MKKHAAPIIAAILLLLPVLYVGSYFALVQPYSRLVINPAAGEQHYRMNSWRILPTLFWPLEQVDRKVRAEIWDEELIRRRLLDMQRSG